MARLRAQEVAALRRALDTERSNTRAAQERAQGLQAALDSERSAVRALRRDAAAAARAVREEEAARHAALLDQLKTRLELAAAEAVAREKESVQRALTAEFQREMLARQEEWRRDTRRQLEPLQEQLREATKPPPTSRAETEALAHTLHLEYTRALHQKQEEWKRETRTQVEVLSSQLRDLQRLHADTCNKLTTTTNEAELVPKLRQDIQTLKHDNKELEEKIQILLEAERRKSEEFRCQHEEHTALVADLQRAARKEAFQLLEEMKGKERALSQLRREYHILATRLSGDLSTSRLPSASESSLRVSVC